MPRATIYGLTGTSFDATLDKRNFSTGLIHSQSAGCMGMDRRVPILTCSKFDNISIIFHIGQFSHIDY